VGVVSHVKVLSDRVEDVSTLQAWRQSFIDDALPDETKGLMVWHSAVKFILNDWPALEYIQNKDMVVDPIKIMNVYGYTYCGPHAATVIGLARSAGLEARGWGINGHIVAEVYWDGDWHLLDSSLVNFFPDAGGSPASVREIVTAVTDWLDDNPGYGRDAEPLEAFQMADGGRGWTRGPRLLANSPFYSYWGWLPAQTHNWASAMREYDSVVLSEGYEMPYSLGYQVNIQLRPGERLTLNWSNNGLHVNMNEARFPADTARRMGEGTARHTPAFGDLAPGRIGNGTLEYKVPLSGGRILSSALRVENLGFASADGGAPEVYARSPEAPGILEIRMPSSYVFLTGRLRFSPVVQEGGAVRVLYSQNHGLDWIELARVTSSVEQRVDLTPLVLRRYDYRLRFVLEGKGTGLDTLRIHHDIQHSQRALPALGRGLNTITFSSGPQEGTITLEGSLDVEDRSKQVLWAEYRPRLQGIREKNGWEVEGRRGVATIPIETPGDLVRLRLTVSYRARDRRDAWEIGFSLDDGTSYRSVGRCGGPRLNYTCSFTVSGIPPKTRSALVRLVGEQWNATRIKNLRVDADFREPQGGFRPVRITYVWDEAGTERRHSHVAATPQDTYQIQVGKRFRMKSLVLELAP
jgi:hypothetical protein